MGLLLRSLACASLHHEEVPPPMESTGTSWNASPAGRSSVGSDRRRPTGDAWTGPRRPGPRGSGATGIHSAEVRRGARVGRRPLLLFGLRRLDDVESEHRIERDQPDPSALLRDRAVELDCAGVVPADGDEAAENPRGDERLVAGPGRADPDARTGGERDVRL